MLSSLPSQKGAEAPAGGAAFRPGADGPLGPVGGDDHPAADDRVFAQLRHRQTSAIGSGANPSQCLVHVDLSFRAQRFIRSHMIRSKSADGPVQVDASPVAAARSRLWLALPAARRRTGSARPPATPSTLERDRRPRRSGRPPTSMAVALGRLRAARVQSARDRLRRRRVARCATPNRGSTKPMRKRRQIGQDRLRAGPSKSTAEQQTLAGRSRNRPRVSGPARPCAIVPRSLLAAVAGPRRPTRRTSRGRRS